MEQVVSIYRTLAPPTSKLALAEAASSTFQVVLHSKQPEQAKSLPPRQVVRLQLPFHSTQLQQQLVMQFTYQLMTRLERPAAQQSPQVTALVSPKIQLHLVM